jgi:hypothetical protein
LTPEWEKLAKATKGYITVAYWDTEESGRPPKLLGDYQGTPTIRLFVPKPKQHPDSVAKKNVLDYQYERKAADMKKFAEGNMPNFLESIKGLSDLTKFQAKAMKYGLPQVLIFTSKAKTLALTKYLSTEFRRKLLIAEIHPTKLNQDVIAQVLGSSSTTEFPAILVFPVGSSEPIRYTKDDGGFTRHKLHSFLSKHALKEKVLPPAKTKNNEQASTSKEQQQEQQQNSAKESVRVGSDGEL